VHVLRRCSSLQALEVDALPRLKLSFHGWGQTPAEQRSSMQQQVEAFCGSSGAVLAPPSWPACACLTALTLDVSTTEGQHPPILSSALQTPSLVDLRVTSHDDMAADAAASLLQQLSALSNLTRLSVQLDLDGQQPADPRDALELLATAARRMSSLQQLAFLWSSDPHEGACRVPSLSQLSRLTQLELRLDGVNVDLRSLSGATALQHLALAHCTGLGCLTSLFLLTGLTSLHGPLLLEPAAEDGGSAAAQAPAAWRRGLQCLQWPGAQQGAWPRVVPQLTALTYLCTSDVCVSPDLCRCVLPE
jgi:hypothetical protein